MVAVVLPAVAGGGPTLVGVLPVAHTQVSMPTEGRALRADLGVGLHRRGGDLHRVPGDLGQPGPRDVGPGGRLTGRDPDVPLGVGLLEGLALTGEVLLEGRVVLRVQPGRVAVAVVPAALGVILVRLIARVVLIDLLLELVMALSGPFAVTRRGLLLVLIEDSFSCSSRYSFTFPIP